jgi:hypothetical protein
MVFFVGTSLVVGLEAFIGADTNAKQHGYAWPTRLLRKEISSVMLQFVWQLPRPSFYSLYQLIFIEKEIGR